MHPFLHRLIWPVAAVLLMLSARSPLAAELVMFEQAACPWCARFDHEIGEVYAKTDEGRRAPLRRVNIMAPVPPDLVFIEVERLTPLFVLVDGGREIGRIRGYPGEDHFWGLLGTLLKRLDAGAPRGGLNPAGGKILHAGR